MYVLVKNGGKEREKSEGEREGHNALHCISLHTLLKLMNFSLYLIQLIMTLVILQMRYIRLDRLGKQF